MTKALTIILKTLFERQSLQGSIPFPSLPVIQRQSCLIGSNVPQPQQDWALQLSLVMWPLWKGVPSLFWCSLSTKGPLYSCSALWWDSYHLSSAPGTNVLDLDENQEKWKRSTEETCKHARFAEAKFMLQTRTHRGEPQARSEGRE